MTHTAYIGIGSNLGIPGKNCIDAIQKVSTNNDIKVISKSSFYQTAPIGHIEQNWFVNSVIKINTSLNPNKLLSVLLKNRIRNGEGSKTKMGPARD